MIINVPTLGPSWVPKLAAIAAVINAALAAAPANSPTILAIQPWVPVINAAISALIGFSVRQNNVTSERAGAVKPPETPKP